uniref:Phosphatidylinositol-3-phosphatase SAC1 n=1 Tax=Panagrellus redivivus TaxID=6233 RepID=A0A7E4UTD1_PANRE
MSAQQLDVYERYNLYISNEKFFVEPRTKTGSLASNVYLEIDRTTTELRLQSETPLLLAGADVIPIYGIVGIVKLVAGPYLVVIKKAEVVGTVNDAEIYHVTETEALPFNKSTLHLTERQSWFNKHFLDMIQLVLATRGFYYSPSFDLTHSLQWLSENVTPDYRSSGLHARADQRFVWNRHLLTPLAANPSLAHFTIPLIHGFVGIRTCIVRGSTFKLAIISRRSIHRAGVRFYKRGTDYDGNSANFVETEQIIEFDRDQNPANRVLTSFIQLRGSIPLRWSQKPNLRWQPLPLLKPTDDQLEAYVKHMRHVKQIYGGKHVLVNLVNTKGREKSIGGELERVSVQANLDFVRYVGFDFHKESSKSLNWDSIGTVLGALLDKDIVEFGYFYSNLANPVETRSQSGYFRTNCMDCLDRTNVVQAMIAKASLRHQLLNLGIVDGSIISLDDLGDFIYIFKNLWADNGDECSKQYAGTGALKTDYTRTGKRTLNGALQDGVNALTRYFKNNFADGYRQDAIDLFLGRVQVQPAQLPSKFEDSVFNVNTNGGAIAGAIFSAAMMMLCVLVSENVTATLFWLIVFIAFMFFIFLHGEEFVSRPKLKQD